MKKDKDIKEEKDIKGHTLKTSQRSTKNLIQNYILKQ